MKKGLHLLVLTSVLLMISACGSEVNSKNNSAHGEDKIEETNQSAEQTIKVDKKLLNVEVTLPAIFVEKGEEMGDVLKLTDDDKENGISKKVENADGSITFTLSKAKHKEMLQEMQTGAEDVINELLNDENFTSFKELTFDKKLRNLKVTVDREAFENSFDGFGVLGLVFYSLFYQVLDGRTEEEIQMDVTYIDSLTQEVFDTARFPDDMENSDNELAEENQ